MARETGDREQIGWHTGVLSQAHIAGGDLPGAIALMDSFLADEKSISDVAYFSSAWLNLLVGRWDRALDDCRAVHAMHLSIQSIHTTWTLSMAGFLLTSMGRAFEAGPLLATADRTYGERDFYIFSGFHEWMSGCAARARGDLAEARRRLVYASDMLWNIDAKPMFAQVAVDAIDVQVALGETAEARDLAKRLADGASELGDPLSAVHASFGAGLTEVNQKLKTPMLAEAAAQANKTGAVWLQARATEAAGEAGADVELLAEAGRLYAGLPSATDGSRVLGRLRAAGSKGVRVAQTVGELTSREREIASLAARGMSDKQIADRLQLSVRTIQSHLAHVYGKLQIAGRSDLPK
jgi:DNA-binding CsgD family transcriptional regulator